MLNSLIYKMIKNQEINILDSRSILYAMLHDIFKILSGKDPDRLQKLKNNAIQKLNLEKADESTLRQNNMYIMVEAYAKLVKEYQKEMVPRIFKLYSLSINSIKSSINLEFDKISERNRVSLFVYSYCMVAYFKYIFTEELGAMKFFDKKIADNLLEYLKVLHSEKALKKVVNTFLDNQWNIKGKSKNDTDIIISILESSKNSDFTPNYNEFSEKIIAKKLKKKENKIAKKKINSKNETENKKEEPINEIKEKNFEEI